VKTMTALANEKRVFDLVICDPPKLAPTRAGLAKATNKYKQINTLAMRFVLTYIHRLIHSYTHSLFHCRATELNLFMDTYIFTFQRLVKPGGLLLSCTCSAAMTQAAPPVGGFEAMLFSAAKAAQRDVTVLRSAGAGADHPVLLSYPEGRYLTATLLSVH
jgi:23S rRNA G2069 N7-methylase RlmK/C1962 C5-methylase RlmI